MDTATSRTAASKCSDCLPLADISAKTADVEARGAVVNDVRRKADAVVCLLDDIRVTLDTVSEQKAMIDHVAEHLVRLDDAIAEARGTTKALQTERKLAQRIVENIRTVHARAGESPEGGLKIDRRWSIPNHHCV